MPPVPKGVFSLMLVGSGDAFCRNPRARRYRYSRSRLALSKRSQHRLSSGFSANTGDRRIRRRRHSQYRCCNRRHPAIRIARERRLSARHIARLFACSRQMLVVQRKQDKTRPRYLFFASLCLLRTSRTHTSVKDGSLSLPRTMILGGRSLRSIDVARRQRQRTR